VKFKPEFNKTTIFCEVNFRENRRGNPGTQTILGTRNIMKTNKMENTTYKLKQMNKTDPTKANPE
jgi:hypothetical protein